MQVAPAFLGLMRVHRLGSLSIGSPAFSGGNSPLLKGSPRQRGEPRHRGKVAPSTRGTETQGEGCPLNGGNREKFERFPPLAGGTYRRGDETLAGNCAVRLRN